MRFHGILRLFILRVTHLIYIYIYISNNTDIIHVSQKKMFATYNCSNWYSHLVKYIHVYKNIFIIL